MSASYSFNPSTRKDDMEMYVAEAFSTDKQLFEIRYPNRLDYRLHGHPGTKVVTWAMNDEIDYECTLFRIARRMFFSSGG